LEGAAVSVTHWNSLAVALDRLNLVLLRGETLAQAERD